MDPGYWAWAGVDIIGCPGTWVQPPRVGVLVTPDTGGFIGGCVCVPRRPTGDRTGIYGGQ